MVKKKASESSTGGSRRTTVGVTSDLSYNRDLAPEPGPEPD